jgi:hypothetical protein
MSIIRISSWDNDIRPEGAPLSVNVCWWDLLYCCLVGSSHRRLAEFSLAIQKYNLKTREVNAWLTCGSKPVIPVPARVKQVVAFVVICSNFAAQPPHDLRRVIGGPFSAMRELC